MQIKELRERITASGGTRTIGPVIAEYRDGGDIDFYVSTQLIAWISSHHSEDGLAEERLSCMNDVLQNINGLVAIAEFFGISAASTSAAAPQRDEVDRSEEHRLAGKVEAYEKILIGREISVKA